MAIRFENVKAGDTLYEVSGKNGCQGTRPVYIVSIDTATDTAVVKWNGNRAEQCSRRDVERLRKSPPGSGKAIAIKHREDSAGDARNDQMDFDAAASSGMR